MTSGDANCCKLPNKDILHSNLIFGIAFQLNFVLLIFSVSDLIRLIDSLESFPGSFNLNHQSNSFLIKFFLRKELKAPAKNQNK